MYKSTKYQSTKYQSIKAAKYQERRSDPRLRPNLRKKNFSENGIFAQERGLQQRREYEGEPVRECAQLSAGEAEREPEQQRGADPGEGREGGDGELALWRRALQVSHHSSRGWEMGHCRNSLGANCRKEENLVVDRYIGRNSVSIQVARVRERMLES